MARVVEPVRRLALPERVGRSMLSLALITSATSVDFAAVATTFCGACDLCGLFLVTAAAKWRLVCKVRACLPGAPEASRSGEPEVWGGFAEPGCEAG